MLTGRIPFQSYPLRKHDASDASFILDKIVAGDEFNLNGPLWTDMSAKAKSVIRGLLTLNAERRLTIEELMDHPWLAQPMVTHSNFYLTRRSPDSVGSFHTCHPNSLTPPNLSSASSGSSAHLLNHHQMPSLSSVSSCSGGRSTEDAASLVPKSALSGQKRTIKMKLKKKQSVLSKNGKKGKDHFEVMHSVELIEEEECETVINHSLPVDNRIVPVITKHKISAASCNSAYDSGVQSLTSHQSCSTGSRGSNHYMDTNRCSGGAQPVSSSTSKSSLSSLSSSSTSSLRLSQPMQAPNVTTVTGQQQQQSSCNSVLQHNQYDYSFPCTVASAAIQVSPSASYVLPPLATMSTAAATPCSSTATSQPLCYSTLDTSASSRAFDYDYEHPCRVTAYLASLVKDESSIELEQASLLTSSPVPSLVLNTSHQTNITRKGHKRTSPIEDDDDDEDSLLESLSLAAAACETADRTQHLQQQHQAGNGSGAITSTSEHNNRVYLSNNIHMLQPHTGAGVSPVQASATPPLVNLASGSSTAALDRKHNLRNHHHVYMPQQQHQHLVMKPSSSSSHGNGQLQQHSSSDRHQHRGNHDRQLHHHPRPPTKRRRICSTIVIED